MGIRAMIVGDLAVSAGSAMRGLTVRVRVKGLHVMRMRLLLGAKLFRLAAFVTGCACHVDIE